MPWLHKHTFCLHPGALNASSPQSVVQKHVVLQIQGLPTMVFVGLDKSKPALRTEGLLPATSIIQIIKEQLMNEQPIDVAPNEQMRPTCMLPTHLLDEWIRHSMVIDVQATTRLTRQTP